MEKIIDFIENRLENSFMVSIESFEGFASDVYIEQLGVQVKETNYITIFNQNKNNKNITIPLYNVNDLEEYTINREVNLVIKYKTGSQIALYYHKD